MTVEPPAISTLGECLFMGYFFMHCLFRIVTVLSGNMSSSQLRMIKPLFGIFRGRILPFLNLWTGKRFVP